MLPPLLNWLLGLALAVQAIEPSHARSETWLVIRRDSSDCFQPLQEQHDTKSEVEVTIAGKQYTDNELKSLVPKLKTARKVNIFDTSITDDGLQCLTECQSITALVLHSPRISNVGLSHIGNMKNLAELSLMGNANLTDDGLKHFGQLVNLRSVCLSLSDIKGEGLRYLKGLPIVVLDLGGTKVDDKAMQYVADLASLEELNVGCTHVTDVGVKRIAALKHLVKLDLQLNENVTDDGLVHLHQMTSLRELIVEGTSVSENGKETLCRQLPKLDVKR